MSLLLQRGAIMMTEAAIDGRFSRDLYAALGRAGRRILGGASVLQTLRALDLVRRRLCGARHCCAFSIRALSHGQKLSAKARKRKKRNHWKA